MPKRSRAPQRQTTTSNTYRFFVEAGVLHAGTVRIDDPDLAHQVGTVLRLRPGERLILLDNSGWQYTVALSAVERGCVAGEVERKELAGGEPRTKVTLYAALMRPERFDVIVTTNLFGDILSDLTSGLVGGLGLTPGANIGYDCGIFEAVHGTAPDIAGKGVANPTAVMLAGCQLLDHVGEKPRADRIRAAIEATLRERKVVTRDVGGTAGTDEYTDAVIARLKG